MMRAVTLKEAKARLNELVDAVTRGEQVVLRKGAKHVAAIVPLSAAELELPPRLTDAQAERLWRSLAQEQRQGGVRTFESAAEAVGHLRKTARRGRKPRVSR